MNTTLSNHKSQYILMPKMKMPKIQFDIFISLIPSKFNEKLSMGVLLKKKAYLSYILTIHST